MYITIMDLHQIYLHEMLKRLPEVDEDPNRLEAIITEIMLFKYKGTNHVQACDYIGVYREHINLIELKRDYKASKARAQMVSTKHRVEDFMQRRVKDMKMVIYRDGLYQVHYL